MKKCKHCQEGMEAGSKFCVRCGKRQGTSTFTGCVAVLLVLGLFYFLNAAKNYQPADTNAPTAAALSQEPSQNLEMVGNYGWERGEAGLFLIGLVKNNSGVTIQRAQIAFSLYNKYGQQVGSTSTSMSGLEPDGTWKFRAAVTDHDVVTASVSELTGR